MTSEIKVDTISEQTSANGVTIDGLTIKDGNIIGDVALAGTTPTFTIGDGGAEDAALIFDGNAQDFYMALDDSADDLVIGTGSTIGSNVKMVIENGGNVGIGTSTLDAQVHILKNDSGALLDANADNLFIEDNTTGITIGSSNSGEGHIRFSDSDDADVGAIGYFHSDNYMNFRVNGSETLRIDSSGNVGIGTTSIDVSTQAGGSGYRVLQLENNEGGQINLDHTDAGTGSTLGQINFQRAGEVVAEIEGVTDGATDNGKINFRTQPDGGALTVRMTIDHDGNVKITNDANVYLSIDSTQTNGDEWHIFNAVSGSSSTLQFKNIDQSAVVMLLDESGKVGIGTTSPDRELSIGGVANARIGIISTDNSTGACQLHFGDADDSQVGRIMYEHDGNKMTFHTSATERLRIHGAGQLSTGGETDSNVDAGGLCLNTGANDGRTLSFKNSDVAHGMTSVVQTDTYAYFQKKGAAAGGLKIGGLVETGFIAGIELDSNVTQADNAETAGAEGAIQTQSLIKSGTGTTAMGADDNIFVCRNSTTQFIVKGDGELFSNQSATVGTFDEYEDAHLVRAYDLSHGKGVIDSSFDKFVKYNKDDLQKARLIGSDKEGNATPFVNITGMSRLHNGAIWQQYEKHQRLASAFYKLEEKTIGKEEADKLLTEEEIQLLN